jgi:hypothetical protein
MQTSLDRRVTALEAKPSQAMGRTHRIIVDGKSKETALANYEAAEGVKVADGNLVIFRTIID